MNLSFPSAFHGRTRSQLTPLTLLVILTGLGVGTLTSILLVSGRWQLAAALIVALPGLIVLHKYPFLTLILWLVLAPFLLHTTTAPERQVYWIVHRALPPLTVGLILLTAKIGLRKVKLPRLGFPELLMAAYLVFGTLSIIMLSPTRQATLYHFYDRVFSPMCLYLIIRLTVPGDREWGWLLPVVFFIALSQSAIGVLSWVAPGVLPGKWLDKVGERTTGTLINPSIYTTALTFAGLLLLHGIHQIDAGLKRRLFAATFLLSWFGIFISFSRASWLAGLLVLFGLFFLYPRFMLRLGLVVGLVSLLAGGILFSSYLDKARQRLYSSEAENSALDRLPGFLAAYRMFQEKPLLGWGYGNFDVYDAKFMGRVLDFANDNKDHASHNWFLSYLAEQGLIGSLLFFGPLLWWFVPSLKKLRRLPRDGLWGRDLLIFLWLVVLAEVVINNFMNMLIFFGHGLWWIVLGLIAVMVQTERGARAGSRRPRYALRSWHLKIAPGLAGKDYA